MPPKEAKWLTMATKTRIKTDGFQPLKGNVFVSDLDHGPSLTRGGLIIPDDNMTERGVRDRWCKVWAIGPDVTEVKVGDWVLVKHGRWTTGIDMEIKGIHHRVWRIEFPDAVLLVTDNDPRTTMPTTM